MLALQVQLRSRTLGISGAASHELELQVQLNHQKCAADAAGYSWVHCTYVHQGRNCISQMEA